MTPTSEQIEQVAEQLQKECNRFVESEIDKIKRYYGEPCMEYANFLYASNAWTIMKLAEHELRLKELEGNK